MKTITKTKEIIDPKMVSLVEHEVKKRLTWRIILLSTSPVPFVLLLIYFLYCYVQMRCINVDYLENRHIDIERRLRVLEQKLNVDNRGQTSEPPAGVAKGPL